MNNIRNTLAIALFTLFLLTSVILQPAQAQIYTVIHTFTGPDGINPSPIIRDAQGNMYGTTYAGGLASCDFGACGTVFKIDPAGNESVVFGFPGGAAGSNPIATVTEDAAGNLYGTTEGSGFLGLSVVYKIDPNGQETVLATDTQTGGAVDSPVFVDKKGNLYGMTPYGGDLSCSSDGFGCGMLFGITQSGIFTMLHAFSGSDGMRPEGGLVQDSKGNLYGVAFAGGDLNCKTVGFQYPDDPNNREPGCGTIFKLDVHGKFTILHTFTGPEGGGPLGLIIDSAGNLYGIAQNGGDYSANPYGLGTIFKVDTTTNALSVLFIFEPPQTNSTGYASLLVRDSKGNLYGAKQHDGAHSTGCLFRIDTKGNYTDLYDFAEYIQGSPEGYFPVGLVLGSAHDIYGSMFYGGIGAPGEGVIFHITP